MRHAVRTGGHHPGSDWGVGTNRGRSVAATEAAGPGRFWEGPAGPAARVYSLLTTAVTRRPGPTRYFTSSEQALEWLLDN